MSFEFNRLGGGERIVACGVIALLISMFLFKWFAIKVPAFFIGAYISAAGVSTSANAWNSLEVIRWLLLFTALVGIAMVVLAASGRKPRLPVSVSMNVAGLGALVTILVFYRVIVSHPFAHAEVRLGAWLGLASCAVIAYGGYRAVADEGALLADASAAAPAP